MFRPGQRKNSGSPLLKGCAAWPGAFFILFWSACTLTFDGVLLYGVAMQLWSYTYSETQGTILSSAVVDNHDDEGGTTHNVAIKYQYTVDGRLYRGERYRYCPMASGGSWAEKVTTQYPVDSRRPVYYNPRRPDEAVLLRGIEGIDLFFALFLTPFNLIMAGGWVVAARWLRGNRLGEDGPSGRHVHDDGAKLTVHLPEHSALLVAAVALGGTAFIAIFIAGFATGMRPSFKSMLICWGIVLAITGYATIWQLQRNLAGRSDFVIDRLRKMVTLPATRGRKTLVELPSNRISDVSVRDESTTDSDGDRHPKFAVVLLEAAATPESEPMRHKLCQESDRDRAERFAAWLREQLGLARSPAAACPAKMAE